MSNTKPDRRASDPHAHRRALTHVGGEVALNGDPDESAKLRTAAIIPADSDARVYTHGLHTYPARMHPHTAKHLIAMAPQGTILDPFMGGGTVLVESMLAGRGAHGRDVNPLALEIGWARTRLWRPERIDEWRESALSVLSVAREQRGRTRLPDRAYRSEKPWYDPPALMELWTLRDVIAGVEDASFKRLSRMCLSSLIVKASRQASDSVPKLDRNHQYIPKNRVLHWFERRIEEITGQLKSLGAAVPADARDTPNIRSADARTPDPVIAGQIAAIVTSPPYPGVYDYVEHQRRRYVMLGMDSFFADRHEIGRRQTVIERGWMSASWRFRDDLGHAMKAWDAALSPGGRVWLVIGDGQHRDGVIRVLPLVESAAERAGFEISATASQTRPVFGTAAADTNATRNEYIIGLKRSS
jgi:DNA modification methylase